MLKDSSFLVKNIYMYIYIYVCILSWDLAKFYREYHHIFILVTRAGKRCREVTGKYSRDDSTLRPNTGQKVLIYNIYKKYYYFFLLIMN